MLVLGLLLSGCAAPPPPPPAPSTPETPLPLSPTPEPVTGDPAQIYRQAVQVYESGATETSIAEFGRVLALAPDHVEARLYLARALDKAGRGAEAVQELDVLIEVHPDHAGAYYLRGTAQSLLGKEQAALEDYGKAIQHGYGADAYLARGALHSLRKEHDAAISDLNRAIEKNPGERAFYYQRALAYSRAGKQRQAQEDFLRARRSGSGQPVTIPTSDSR